MSSKKKLKSRKKIIFFGHGSHLKVVKEIAQLNNFEIKGIICDGLKKKKTIFNLPYLGNRNYLKKVNKKETFFSVAIGDNKLREKIFNMLKKKGFKFAKLIHPSALISKNSLIKDGTTICAKSIINPNSFIGQNCIINSASLIEHDVKVKNHCHVAPGVKIGGQTLIGTRSLIGIGSTIIDKIKIMKDTTIGAGSLVIKNCKVSGVYFGRPAKLKKINL